MKEVILGARTLLGLAWRNNKAKTMLAVSLMLFVLPPRLIKKNAR